MPYLAQTLLLLIQDIKKKTGQAQYFNMNFHQPNSNSYSYSIDRYSKTLPRSTTICQLGFVIMDKPSIRLSDQINDQQTLSKHFTKTIILFCHLVGHFLILHELSFVPLRFQVMDKIFQGSRIPFYINRRRVPYGRVQPARSRQFRCQ